MHYVHAHALRSHQHKHYINTKSFQCFNQKKINLLHHHGACERLPNLQYADPELVSEWRKMIKEYELPDFRW